MNRFLQCFNFLGIFALAALCCAQWRINRQLNLQAIDLEKMRIEQQFKIAEQDKIIKGQSADLDDFRHRLELSEAALKDADDKFAKLAAERDQLKAQLNQWAAAIAQRDAALKQESDQIAKLAAARDDAISKFNDLANRYNALVKPPSDTKSKAQD